MWEVQIGFRQGNPGMTIKDHVLEGVLWATKDVNMWFLLMLLCLFCVCVCVGWFFLFHFVISCDARIVSRDVTENFNTFL